MTDLHQFQLKVRRLYAFRGYFERFFELLQENTTSLQAYEALEREYYDVFGENRYSSYETFKVMRRRYVIYLQTARKPK
jgi:hypothetical protein